MVYIVEGPKCTHKRRKNQLQERRLNDSNDVPQTKEEPIDTIFDMLDLDPPQPTPEIHRSWRKKKFNNPLMIDPIRKKILTALLLYIGRFLWHIFSNADISSYLEIKSWSRDHPT